MTHDYGLFWGIVAGFVLFHVAACCRWWEKLSRRLPAPVLGCSYGAALTLCMLLAPAAEKPFIYFQF